jgi:hypothetical protein
MKATLKRTINVKETEEIINAIVKTVISDYKGVIGRDPEEEDQEQEWDWNLLYNSNGPIVFSSEDYYVWVRMDMDLEGVKMYSYTSGGHYHSITFGWKGEIVVEHEGARSSVPGALVVALPEEWFKFNHIAGWEVIEYETSEPGWAKVVGLLQGQIGNGPSNAREELEMRLKKKLNSLKEKFEAIGKTIPEGLSASTDGFYYREGVKYKEFKYKFSPVEYRRAAVMGIKLD